jgi:two-component system sensor histidine kinase RegB
MSESAAKTSSKREAGPTPGAGARVRLRSLVLIRWVAILGQLAIVLVVHLGLGFTVPLVPVALLIAASAAVNLQAAYRGGGLWLNDRAAAGYLAFDLVQLLLLLAVTGGLNNPFVILILAPVVVSAARLSRRSTLLLSGLAIAGITLLGLWHLPLPWTPPGLALPDLYLATIWGALALAVIFTAGYVSALASESQRREDALAATQLALGREQRLSALGGLAAAAAHELGSPLATITLVTRELEHEIERGLTLGPEEEAALRRDIALLRSESERCREILAALAQRPEDDRDSPYHRLPLSSLVEAAAAPYARQGVELTIEFEAPASSDAQPILPRRPEVLYGLGMLLQNALQFASARVTVTLAWDAERLRLRLRDDGPGISDLVLGELGAPYVTTGGQDRRGAGDYLGLGVFIAVTLLARSGATLEFVNPAAGGAEVVIAWPRCKLEGEEP